MKKMAKKKDKNVRTADELKAMSKEERAAYREEREEVIREKLMEQGLYGRLIIACREAKVSHVTKGNLLAFGLQCIKQAYILPEDDPHAGMFDVSAFKADYEAFTGKASGKVAPVEL